MNILKPIVLFVFCLILPAGALADTPPTETAKPAAKVEKFQPTTMAKVEAAKPVTPVKAGVVKKPANKTKAPAAKKKPAGLIIGKNLKVGMSLNEAIKLLGIPQTFKVKRGTESKLDSISIEYANHGIVLHSLNGKRQIEALEILPRFAGSFAEGVKLGANVKAMIDKYGVPESMNDSLAKYPKRGLYFSLKGNVMIAAQVFAKNSKLLIHQLYKH